MYCSLSDGKPAMTQADDVPPHLSLGELQLNKHTKCQYSAP